MLARYWLSHPPIGVGLVIVLLLLFAGLIDHQHSPGGTNYSAGEKQRQTQDASASRVTTQGIATEAYASRQEERAERDLKAQEDMAKWAMWMFWATAVGIVLLAATLRETWRAGVSAGQILEATKQQVDLAEKTAAIELRAYLSAVPMGINRLTGKEYSYPSHEGMAHIAVRNVGRLPARNVSVIVRMKVMDWRNAVLDVPNELDPTDRVIQPGAEMIQGSQEVLPETDLMNPQNYIFVWGVIYYDNGYGKRCMTRYCHRYNGASHNQKPWLGADVAEGQEWRRKPYIDANKARYHESGNSAD